MFFPKEDLVVFCCYLVLLTVTNVLPCSFVAFLVFQYDLSAIYIQQLDGGLFLAPSMHVVSSIFWGFRGHLDSCFRSLKFAFKWDYNSQSVCCRISCRETHQFGFQRSSSLVSSIVFGLAVVPATLLSFTSDMLRLPPFVSTFTATSDNPGSCSACLARCINGASKGQ